MYRLPKGTATTPALRVPTPCGRGNLPDAARLREGPRAARLLSSRPAAVLALFLLANRGRPPGMTGFYCAGYLLSILIVSYPDTGRYAVALSPFLVGQFVAGARGAMVR